MKDTWGSLTTDAGTLQGHCAESGQTMLRAQSTDWNEGLPYHHLRVRSKEVPGFPSHTHSRSAQIGESTDLHGHDGAAKNVDRKVAERRR